MKLTSIFQIVALIALSVPAVCTPIGVDAFAAGATVIDFDDLAAGDCNGCGTQVTNQYSLFGIVFVNPNYPGEATAQTNITPGMIDASGPNILWVRQGGLIGEPAATPFQLLLSSNVLRVGMNFATSKDAYFQLDAYNGDELLESMEVAGSPTVTGLSGFAGLQTLQAITRLDVSSHPFADPSRTLNFSLDNVRFQDVPEASSLWISAISLVGVAIRRVIRRTS